VYPKEPLEVASCHCGGPAGNPGAFSVPGLVAQNFQFTSTTAGCSTTKDRWWQGRFWLFLTTLRPRASSTVIHMGFQSSQKDASPTLTRGLGTTTAPPSQLVRRKQVSKREDRPRGGGHPSNSGMNSSGQPHQAAQPPSTHSTEISQQHPHLPLERGTTSLGHETFPLPVFTSGKKQAQAVLEATAASQM